MENDFIHLHENRLKTNLGFFLLFLPILIFVITLFSFIYANRNGRISQILGQNPVLGESTQSMKEGK